MRTSLLRCGGDEGGSARAVAVGVLLLGAVWLAGCGGDDDGGDGDDGGDDGGEVSFAADIEPIFDAKCVHCHHEDSATQIDLTDPFGEQGIIERENSYVPNGSEFELLVDPGVPDNSFILRKVSGEELDEEVEGAAMPFPTEPLTDGELTAVRDWIEAGAEQDAFEEVASIFGTDNTTIGPAAGKCTFCHPGPQTGLNIIDAFDPVNGLVGVDAELDGTQVRVVPGEPDNSVLVKKLEGDEEVGDQMPFNPEPLSADEIDDLRAWIEAGALDN